jgi:esterase/lipase
VVGAFMLGSLGLFLQTVNALASSSCVSLDPVPAIRKSQIGKGAVGSEAIELFAAQPNHGTILLAHGLNLKPSAMNELALFFQGQGFSVVRLALMGHRGDVESFSKVTLDQWLQEFEQGYCAAKVLSCSGQVSFLGFSLGALVANVFESQHPQTFESQVLFAPALNSRYFTKWLKIFSWFPGLPIPSAANAEFRANGFTPIAAYNALFEGQEVLAEKDMSSVARALVWIDPQDELIDSTELEAWIARKNLPWHMRKVNTKSSSGLRHHQLVSSQNFEKSQWTKILEDSESWFLSHRRDNSTNSLCPGEMKK